MKVNKNMVSGNTAMLILKLISEKDMYGYEMIDTLSKRSDNVFQYVSVDAGTGMYTDCMCVHFLSYRKRSERIFMVVE